MKHLIIILVVFISGTLTAQTLVQTSTDIRYFDNSAVVNTTILATKNVKGKWGISCFGQITKNLRQIYAGPIYNVNDNLTLGISIGIEAPKNPHIRGAVSATYFKGNHSALLFLEKGIGNDNHFYALFYEYKHKHFSYGALVKRFWGTGPSIAISIKSSKFTIAPLYDTEMNILKPTIFYAYVFGSHDGFLPGDWDSNRSHRKSLVRFF